MRTPGAVREVSTVPGCKDCLKASVPLRREDEGKYLLCNGGRVPLDGSCERFCSASRLMEQMDHAINLARNILEGPHE